MTDLVDNSASLHELVGVVNLIIPTIQRLNSIVYNPYTPSKVTADRMPEQRSHFLGLIPEAVRKTVRFGKILVQCMSTRRFGNGEEVIAAHIIPCKTSPAIFNELHLTIADSNSTRNILFLSANIEDAFDRLQLSFISKDRLHPKSLVMKIWDNSIRDMAIYDGSKFKIGEFEGCLIALNGHNPFFRCLSYQAMLAWGLTVSGGISHFEKPDSFGTPEGASFLSQHLVALRIGKAEEGEDDDA